MILSDTPSVPSESPSISRKKIDEELIRRFLADDESAFTEIVQEYKEKLENTAYHFIRNRTEAEDIVQDAFIRAHRNLKHFRGDSSLATWLYRIVVNLSRNRYWYLRRRKVHMSVSMDAPISDDTELGFRDLIASDFASPAKQLSVTEFEYLVEKCIRRLNRGHREILGLRIEQHMSYEEISEAFGVSVGTVKSRIARARDNLLEVMASMCPDLRFKSDVIMMVFDTNHHTGTIQKAL